MEGRSLGKLSTMRQPMFVSATFRPAIRIALAVLTILAGIYFAIGFIITGLMFAALFYTFCTMFFVNYPAALMGAISYIGGVALYLTLCVLSWIFAKRLLWKQAFSKKLVVAYIVLIIVNITFQRVLLLLFQIIFAGLGA